MTYNEFKHNIVTDISCIYGSDHSIIVNTVTKNNNLTLDALIIQQEDSVMAPSIYLNGYYPSYCKGELTYKNILASIIQTYETYKDSAPFDVDSVCNYEAMKDRIAFKLINFKKNIELLDSVPFYKYLDLAVVFFLYLISPDGECGSILINDSIMESYGITLEDLRKEAEINTPKLFPALNQNLKDMLASLSEKSLHECDVDEVMNAELDMYVLSNAAKTYGAGVILYPNLLSNIADSLGEDFYLIPSSVHEMLYLPVSSIDDASSINELIQTVNASELTCDEYLSDHYYYYSVSERTLKA